jgi:hypothetical protein
MSVTHDSPHSQHNTTQYNTIKYNLAQYWKLLPVQFEQHASFLFTKTLKDWTAQYHTFSPHFSPKEAVSAHL